MLSQPTFTKWYVVLWNNYRFIWKRKSPCTRGAESVKCSNYQIMYELLGGITEAVFLLEGMID